MSKTPAEATLEQRAERFCFRRMSHISQPQVDLVADFVRSEMREVVKGLLKDAEHWMLKDQPVRSETAMVIIFEIESKYNL